MWRRRAPAGKPHQPSRGCAWRLTPASSPGSWIELIYDVGLTDVVTRPLLRCVMPDGSRDEILPGAMLGRAFWVGKIPATTTAILISPVTAPGPFAFRVVAARRLSVAQLAARGWRSRPKYVLLGLGNRLIGDSFLSERHFRRALHSTPIKSYPRWAEARRRPPEWDGFDALPPACATGPHIRVIAASSEPNFLAHLTAQLRAQPWPHWSLAAPASNATEGVLGFEKGARLADCLAGLGRRDLVLAMRPGEEWAPETLAAAGVAALRDISDVYYSDQELNIEGGLRLKPDWSPILARSTDLIGRGWIARADWASEAIGARRATEIGDHPLPVDTDQPRATHLRRVLVRGAALRTSAEPVPPRPSATVTAKGEPCATIIIPTRDRVDLLRNCVQSLQRVEGRADFEMVVVDNGSEDTATLAYLDEIARDGRFRVLKRPGPFNFSALCNAGADQARADILVFLNNDTEAISAHWLERLIAWTVLPSIGAVGAKLLYPNGRLQHAGIVLGVDGHATHFERFRPPDEPGFFGRVNLPHEVSAVTGACLAVEKAKFDAVDGFDAANLPVEFSDIDLCLRLAERGWTALVEPAAVLIHHEAASRKVWRSQEQRYAGQVAYFKSRWRQRAPRRSLFPPGAVARLAYGRFRVAVARRSS